MLERHFFVVLLYMSSRVAEGTLWTTLASGTTTDHVSFDPETMAVEFQFSTTSTAALSGSYTLDVEVANDNQTRLGTLRIIGVGHNCLRLIDSGSNMCYDHDVINDVDQFPSQLSRLKWNLTTSQLATLSPAVRRAVKFDGACVQDIQSHTSSITLARVRYTGDVDNLVIEYRYTVDNLCENNACGEHTNCSVTEDGERRCKCEDGYTDKSCVADEDTYGADYRGTQNTTESGTPCQKWSSQSPMSHSTTPESFANAGVGDHNYCRNPRPGPNLYTQAVYPGCVSSNAENPLWPYEYCDIPKCSEGMTCKEAGPLPDLCENNACGEHTNCSITKTGERRCKCQDGYIDVICIDDDDTDGTKYRGEWHRQTISSAACLKWSEAQLQDPRLEAITPERFPNSGLGDHNYCRNPGSIARIYDFFNNNKPWCITVINEAATEWCAFPACSTGMTCTAITPCYPSPCHKQATCISIDADPGYACVWGNGTNTTSMKEDIKVVGGFLKRTVAVPDVSGELYKCWDSDEMYKVSEVASETYFYGTCRNDPGFYQSCGHLPWSRNDIKQFDDILCSKQIACRGNTNGSRNSWESSVTVASTADCFDSDYPTCLTDPQYRLHCEKNINETKPKCGGSARNSLRKVCECSGGASIPLGKVCDGSMDCMNGDDEYGCNHPNGLECVDKFSVPQVRLWFSPDLIDCDDDWKIESVLKLCENMTTFDSVCGREHEAGVCTTRTGQFNRTFVKRQICHRDQVLCVDGRDQINCTNSDVTYECIQHGTNNTITLPDRVLCKNTTLCEDDITDRCSTPELGCTIHRHFVCDNYTDCPYGLDEAKCSDKETGINCDRRMGNKTKEGLTYILKEWVMDGIKDCVDGEDENEELWKNCTYGRETYWQTMQDKCEIKFDCKNSKTYIDPNKMCDGQRKEGCEIEDSLCQITRKKEVNTAVPSSYRTNPRKFLGPCLPGLTKTTLNSMQSLGSCTDYILEQSFGTVPIRISGPTDNTLDCSGLYGEHYVYAACLNLCLNSSTPCPLVNNHYIKSCPRLENRTMALTKANTLTFVKEISLETEKVFVNQEVFPCTNGNCVPYDKVCDLIDDCGDFSDEKRCDNHYKCDKSSNDSNEIIKKSQVCDGIMDCSSYTDECNVDCPSQNDKHIIHTRALSACSWAIGVTGTAINSFVISRNAMHIMSKHEHTEANLLATASVCLIGLGDTFMSIYLVAISIENAISIRYDQFCLKEYEWLTSSSCEVYGVISTFGSQLSLFAMTFLSIYGALTMRRMVKSPVAEAPFRLKLGLACVSIIGVSALIALLPINEKLKETYFYNGFYIENARLFLGHKRNEDFKPIVNRYYDNITTNTNANAMKSRIQDMFMKPANHLDKTSTLTFNTLGFYGSSKSCVFKYFVDPFDPQRHYTWSLLTTNFLCFVAIAFSYLSVHKLSVTAISAGTVKGRSMFGPLQWKISAIIFTDLCCWLPFIIVCFVHYNHMMDAKPLYPYFSIVVLPLNSVINPLLYDSFFSTIPGRIIAAVRPFVERHIMKSARIAPTIELEELRQELRKNQYITRQPRTDSKQDPAKEVPAPIPQVPDPVKLLDMEKFRDEQRKDEQVAEWIERVEARASRTAESSNGSSDVVRPRGAGQARRGQAALIQGVRANGAARSKASSNGVEIENMILDDAGVLKMTDSRGIQLIVVPVGCRKRVMYLVHDNTGGTHMISRISLKKCSEIFWWESLKLDLQTYVRNCAKCKSDKQAALEDF